MDSSDLFIISDEEMSSPIQTVQSNPVEEHLLKQLDDVQNRINVTTNQIKEVTETTARILNVLEWRTLYGEDISSDSDSDLYTIDGEPIIKRKQRCKNKNANAKTNLRVTSQWQYTLDDKWIIGVELQNISQRTLANLRYYSCINDEMVICGVSMFWELQDNCIWNKINLICPNAVHVVAIMVLNLPMFDEGSVAGCWGTISYNINDTEFQTPVPFIQLSPVETINSGIFFDENKNSMILSLKSTSDVEAILNIQFSKADISPDKYVSRKKQILNFLITKNFEKIHNDVFLVKAHSCLMYCLIEILSIDDDEASIRLSCRSNNQLNIIMHFMQDEFSKVTIKEEVLDKCVEAAKALIRELEMIRDKKSTFEVQEAKLITDLLIS